MKKSHQTKILVVLFFIIGAADLLVLILNELHLRFIFKPLITLSLALLYWVSAKKVNKTYIVALLFASLGDTLLLFKGSPYFLLGLSSFLITHLAYISILRNDIGEYKLKTLFIAALPFIITTVSVILVIKDNLGSLLLPVLAYGVVITTLGGLSFYNYLKKRDLASLLLLLGIFLFVSSDGILAIERFMLPHRELELSVVIMSTYVLAQYLICRYMMQRSTII
ncbi:MAG: lysoplasmalogenase [Flavobacteriaceae bacterium]|nr:lysoplasmalogenase [Flavobacteriaceae bacterium]